MNICLSSHYAHAQSITLFLLLLSSLSDYYILSFLSYIFFFMFECTFSAERDADHMQAFPFSPPAFSEIERISMWHIGVTAEVRREWHDAVIYAMLPRHASRLPPD